MATSEKLGTKAERKGYRQGAHKEKDSLKANFKYRAKTEQNHDCTMEKYERWVERYPKALRSLYKGISPLDLVIVKDFFRFYIFISNSKLDLDSRPTLGLIVLIAEFFFISFRRNTGNLISEEQKSDVYYVSHIIISTSLRLIHIGQWIREVLTEKGIVVHLEKPKFLFGE